MQKLMWCKIAFSLLFFYILLYFPSKILGGWTFDPIAPTVEIVITCNGTPLPANNQCDTNAVVVVNCSDGSGSGCNTDEYPVYCISDVAGCTPSTHYTAPVTIPNTSGALYINAKSYDNAGNSATATPRTIEFTNSWFKLKNTSFNNKILRTNTLPNPPTEFDSDDNNSRYLIAGTAGLILGESSINIGTGYSTYSQNNYYNFSYGFGDTFSPERYLDSVKSNKEYKSSSDSSDPLLSTLSNAQANKINVYVGDLTINSTLGANLIAKKPLVLLVSGNVTIANDFNMPDPESIAIIATGTLTINSTVKQVGGIFIGNNVNIVSSGGATTSNELKVKGNLIAVSGSIDTTKRLRTNPDLPSLFVVFDPQQYLDLLPYLSITTHDLNQSQ